MEEELAALKQTLISLVVSSPTTMTVNSLVKDYRDMVGGVLPVALIKFGYKNCVTFLKERCLDIFVVEGPSYDPILTPKVTKNLRHIDNMVQKQKVQSSTKYKGRRRSIPVAMDPPVENNLIADTFNQKKGQLSSYNYNKVPVFRAKAVTETEYKICSKDNNVLKIEGKHHNGGTQQNSSFDKDLNKDIDDSYESSSSALSKYFNKKQSEVYIDLSIEGTSKGSNDSGRHSSTSQSSTSKLEDMKNEIIELIKDSSEGVWFTDLIPLYKERYGRELNVSRFGLTSLGSLVGGLQPRVAVARPDPQGDYLLRDPSLAAEPTQPRAPLHAPLRAPRRAAPSERDDALPGIEFEADVFPEDCMHHVDSLGAAGPAPAAGAGLEVLVAEVYSPSHFWLQRVGPDHNLAMEDVMDEMNLYYRAEGGDRVLSPGALRAGQLCAALYERDWHRAVVVQVLDCDTVKVRHVDYGTVDTLPARSLRYLLRRFCALPAQAVRARLAACRPAARSVRWPRSACAAFLAACRDTRLYANVAARDTEEDIIETFLTDTRGAEDVCLTRALIRAGHADARHDSALAGGGDDDSYLYPTFAALESGATPNYADICRLLAAGIEPDYVHSYRRHVPAPPTAPPRPRAPPRPCTEPVPSSPTTLPPSHVSTKVQNSHTSPPQYSNSFPIRDLHASPPQNARIWPPNNLDMPRAHNFNVAPPVPILRGAAGGAGRGAAPRMSAEEGEVARRLLRSDAPAGAWFLACTAARAHHSSVDPTYDRY